MDDAAQHHPRLIIIGLILTLFILSACQPDASTITLAFLGDIMLGRGSLPESDSFASINSHLQAADLVMANLESPLTNNAPQVDSDFMLCALPDHAGLLHEWGIDLVSIANNHNLDCGQAGLTDTLSSLAAEGITTLTADYRPIFLQLSGTRLAFLAFDDVSAPLDADSALAAVRQAAVQGASVIVSIHWGLEYHGGASARQQQLARQLTAAGALIIWGHHPHVLQPVEYFQPEGTAADGTFDRSLVLFSLGNAFFDQYGLDDTRQGALVLVQLSGSSIRSVKAVPFLIDVQNGRTLPADEFTGRKILDRLKLEGH